MINSDGRGVIVRVDALAPAERIRGLLVLACPWPAAVGCIIAMAIMGLHFGVTHAPAIHLGGRAPEAWAGADCTAIRTRAVKTGRTRTRLSGCAMWRRSRPVAEALADHVQGLADHALWQAHGVDFGTPTEQKREDLENEAFWVIMENAVAGERNGKPNESSARMQSRRTTGSAASAPRITMRRQPGTPHCHTTAPDEGIQVRKCHSQGRIFSRGSLQPPSTLLG